MRPPIGTNARTADWLPLATIIFVGSLWQVWHYAGAAFTPLAVLWALGAAWVVVWVSERVSLSTALRLAGAAGIVAAAAFVVLYPRLNVQSVALGGVDRDDDADVAVRAAFDGRYPFSERTYLGNEITHMPGSLIVAAPFVAAGGSALENLAVLPFGVLALARWTRSGKAVTLAVGGAATCPAMWHELVTGGNSLAEWTLLSVAATWFAGGPTWRRAAAFGFLLNVRANAFCSGATLLGVEVRRSWWRAFTAAAVVAAFQVGLVAPFLLGGLDRFTPLGSGAGGKFAHLDALFPHGSTVVPALAAVLGAGAAFAASYRWMRTEGVLIGLAAGQLAQFGTLILASASAGDAAWARNWTGYTSLAVVPALAALAARARPQKPRVLTVSSS